MTTRVPQSPVEQKEPIAGCSHSAKIKTPKDASVTATATDTSDTANGSALIEDVLMPIFENDFLDTADLLNFRLVNRSWRDCATSVLLRSSACQISFNIRSVPILSNGNSYSTKAVYCNNNNHGALLDDLNEIISQSPKFPCSSFRFVNKYSFCNTDRKNKIDTSSLRNFFSIYGNNVKTITVGEHIFKSNLSSLLLMYAPRLECLDLQYFEKFWDRDSSLGMQPLFPESTTLPNLKTLVLGPHISSITIELIDVAINLQSVENIEPRFLDYFLDHGKVGLIKKLEYSFHVRNLKELSVFEKLAESEPKLTKLIVTPVRYSFKKRYAVVRESFLKMQMLLNRILESSKDTMEHLEFRICPFGDIRFPVLKNLVCLKLVEWTKQLGGRCSTVPSSSPKPFQLEHRDEDQFAAGREEPNLKFPNEIDPSIYGLCPNRPCDSFPNLKKLQLYIQNYGIEKNGSLILLHTCQSHNENIVPHAYKTLNVLEIHSTLPKTIERAQSVSNLFRNVTILKFQCDKVEDFHYSLWVFSPLAKSIEIYGVENHRGRISLVDSFFTGFTIKMCLKLKRLKQKAATDIQGNPRLWHCRRVTPSICDLKDLTNFKIVFKQLSASFASQVSGFYAFQTMPGTQVTFAHAAQISCNQGKCEMKKHLASISTFVHFTHMNVSKRFKNSDDSYSDSDNDSDNDSHNYSDNYNVSD